MKPLTSVPAPLSAVRATLSGWLPSALRPSRALVVGGVLLLVSAVTSLLLAGAAFADPPPNPCSDRGSGGNVCREDNPHTSEAGKRAKEKRRKVQEARKEFEQLVKERKEKQAASKGVLSEFNVRDRDGSPVSIYQIHADTGDWKEWEPKVQHLLVKIGFQVNLWLVSFGCWLIAWALSFSLAALLIKPVLTISTSLHTNLLVQMGLPSLFLTFAGVVAAWHFMFGTRARAWGELTAALVISALAVGALASPAHLLLSEQDGAVGKARELSAAVAAVTLQGTAAQPADGAKNPAAVTELSAEISRPITDALVDAFVTKPSMLLSYGQVFTGRCEKEFRDARISQAVYEEKLDQEKEKNNGAVDKWLEDKIEDIPGVGGFIIDARRDSAWSTMMYELNTDEAWQEVLSVGPMKSFEENCVKDTGTAKKASVDKIGAVVFLLIATLIVMLFITVIVVSFLNAQFWLAAEAILAKIALVVGVLPGPGRAWLWERVTSIGKCLAMMVLAIGGLAVFIVFITTLVNTPERDLPGGIVIRFIVIDAAAVAAFGFRRRLTATANSLAHRTRTRLGNTRFGGQTAHAQPRAASRSTLGRAVTTAAFLATGSRVVRGPSAAVWATRRRTPGGHLGNVGSRRPRLIRNTASVMRTGLGIIGSGAATAARAGFTQSGRQAVRRRIRVTSGLIRMTPGIGPSPFVPGSWGRFRSHLRTPPPTPRPPPHPRRRPPPAPVPPLGPPVPAPHLPAPRGRRRPPPPRIRHLPVRPPSRRRRRP